MTRPHESAEQDQQVPPPDGELAGDAEKIKAGDGQAVKAGSIIIRQCGTKFKPGANVGLGRDYTIFALTPGKVSIRRRVVSVVAAS